MLVLSLLLILSSCSTKKNTFTRRAYHNLTAHYNGWWNGNESLKDGISELKKNTKDDYSKTLFVFNYGNKDQISGISGDMDRAIEKGSLVALRHSMWFKNREHCNWIDDSYMLIGKANFYKQKYNSARQSFNFVISRYYYNKIKSEAQLWLAKTFIEVGNYQKAESLLDELSLLLEEEKTPYVKKNLDLVYADLYLKSHQAKKAQLRLEKALNLAINKKTRARISYILAQLHQNKNEIGQASTYYQKVIKLNTNYRMTFNAKINLAFLYTHHAEGADGLKKSLNKMLKDSKNKNYLDQVYFALADINLKDHDSLQAIHNLRLAVKSSHENRAQKAKASIQLADLLFQKKRFNLATKYYDTTQQVLPLNYDAYDSILHRTGIYFNLSKKLGIVQTQDSLLAMGQWPTSRLNALADSLVKLVLKAENDKRDEEFAKQQSIAMGNQMAVRPGGGMGMPLGSGNWYFYNPQARSLGYTEFMAKWGNRALVDNWRLSNKKALTSSDIGLDENTDMKSPDSDSLGGGSATDPHSRNYYLKDIPRSQEQIKLAKSRITDALYQAGFIYKEELKQADQAHLLFEDFVSRTQEHPQLLQVYFQLYQYYKSTGQEENEIKYKNLIISHFPDTDYAQLVQNPEYYLEMEKKQAYFKEQYKRTYKAFDRGQYLLSLHFANQALSKPEKDTLKANFLYIKALSMAQTSIADSMYRTLNTLVKSYPDAAISAQAQNILNRRGKSSEEVDTTASPENLKENEFLTEALKIYDYQPEEKHFVLILVDAQKINVKAIEVRIQDFNKNQYQNLSLTTYPFEGQKYIVSIGTFKNQEAAMYYYTTFTNDNYVFPAVLRNDSKTFVISSTNYSRFFKDKNVEKYESFFKEKYTH
jgi:tetratricopeptide (TPR) repeat protein